MPGGGRRGVWEKEANGGFKQTFSARVQAKDYITWRDQTQDIRSRVARGIGFGVENA